MMHLRERKIGSRAGLLIPFVDWNRPEQHMGLQEGR